MKQLVKTADPTSLPTVNYDRVIYNSETDNVIIKGANDNGHPYVDLGLPSGLKWAKYNVGATSETQYGKFFQWGETEQHDTGIPYDWANYKYYNRTSGTVTKYKYDENPDYTATLELGDDAARANMGGDWRMPTQANFKELLDNTDHAWVENFNNSNVNGYTFTSRKNKNNYIFIPASEYNEGISTKIRPLTYHIWSSSVNTTASDYAWALDFYSDSISAEHAFDRCDGMAVRGVL